MATVAVSFTLEYADDYSHRNNSVVGYLREQGLCWEETTSFFLIRTEKSVAQFEIDIWLQTDFDSLRDKVIVIDVSNDVGSTRGKIDYPHTLAGLMPNVKQN